jgi:type I restriction enzyme, R subunit
MNEADTCRKYVTPMLQRAGWDDEPHSIAEQRTFTDGRIVVTGSTSRRREQKRVDYLLRHTRDFPIAVVEAKSDDKPPGDGMQQAKDYAEILDLRFCYATNGKGTLEYDFTTGVEREIDQFPTPDENWDSLPELSGVRQQRSAHAIRRMNLIERHAPRASGFRKFSSISTPNAGEPSWRLRLLPNCDG